MNGFEQDVEHSPSPLSRRRFLVISGLGVAGLTLFPFIQVQASPVFGAVAKFAEAVGASPASSAILDYLKSDELQKKTAKEVSKVNSALGRQGFSDLSRSYVYVPATEATYFFYPAGHKDHFNAVANFFDGGRTRGPKLICTLAGPTLFGVAELAASVARNNSTEVAKRALLPRNKLRVSGGRVDKGYKQPNEYQSDVGIVRVAYKTDGKGRGVVSVEARNGLGTLLAGGDYELTYRLEAPRRPVV